RLGCRLIMPMIAASPYCRSVPMWNCYAVQIRMDTLSILSLVGADLIGGAAGAAFAGARSGVAGTALRVASAPVSFTDRFLFCGFTSVTGCGSSFLAAVRFGLH